MFFYSFNEQGRAGVEQLNAERDIETNRLMYDAQSLARDRGPGLGAVLGDAKRWRRSVGGVDGQGRPGVGQHL